MYCIYFLFFLIICRRYEHKQIMLKEQEDVKKREELEYEMELKERFFKVLFHEMEVSNYV